GLRAGRLQQQGFHLGQDGPAGAVAVVATVGALGDIHGDFGAARRIMERHREVPFWLCVGDVADADGRYAPMPSPLYWIKGNNEQFDAIASGDLPANLHYIPNGELVVIGG